MAPEYRPDIDGLRAVAVLAVLFFHAGFEVFGGGYVGVDIFFVISGFLITTIIVREIGEDTFSIAGFYDRRLRRILPAAITVTAACLLVASVLLNSRDFENLARNSIATNLFVSNIYLLAQTGYFEGPAELKPLLHMWSLSVEEQYYVFFPLLLMFIAKYGHGKYPQILIPLFALSLTASVLGMYVSESFVFYLLPSRGWELLVGSVLAVVALPTVTNVVVRNTLSGVGLLLMVYSILAFTTETPFPSGYAMIPVGGAALVIYAGTSGSTWVNTFLSIRPMVFVGLISYSFYLWHWPVIVYAKYYKVVELTTVEKLQLIAAIFVLSVLSWYVVETPFRKSRTWLPDTRSVFVGSFGATAVVIAVALSVIYTGGLQGRRLTPPLSEDVLSGDPEWDRWNACGNLGRQLSGFDHLCRIGTAGAKASFVLWGDSHAQALTSAVHASASRNGATGAVAFLSACPPLHGIERRGRPRCPEFNQAIFEYLSQQRDIETVILAARWALSEQGTRYKHEFGDPVELIDMRSEQGGTGNSRLFDVGLRRTIRSLGRMGKKVVIVRTRPEIGYDVPAANHSAVVTGRDVNLMVAPSWAEYASRNRAVLALLARLEQESSAVTVNPTALLCDDQHCRAALGGIALYRDGHHLSTFGSKYVSGVFDPLFRAGD